MTTEGFVKFLKLRKSITTKIFPRKGTNNYCTEILTSMFFMFNLVTSYILVMVKHMLKVRKCWKITHHVRYKM